VVVRKGKELNGKKVESKFDWERVKRGKEIWGRGDRM
jgi:hypothetical protein